VTRRNHAPELEQAIAKYREFHRYDPRKIGSFPGSFVIPDRMYMAGSSVNVLYRSGKVDPSTLKKPPRPINYIHDHDAGVKTYLAERIDGAAHVEVPQRVRQVPALTRLGYCLGFAFEDPDGAVQEVEGRSPLPDLYTTPDGRCLLVIQSRRTVLAMMWGGGLGVFARGIDG
jgi:hypothetical protein